MRTPNCGTKAGILRIVLLLAGMLLTSGAFGATYSVCSSGCDYATLYSAFVNVPSGNTIELRQDITESISLNGASVTTNKTLTITSDSTRRKWIPTSGRNLEFFNTAPYDHTYVNIDFGNSNSEMFYMNQDGTLRYQNCTFTNSTGSNRLLQMQNGGHMYFYQCELVGNATSAGGVQVESGVGSTDAIIMENTIIRDIGNGSALQNLHASGPNMFTISNCTFEGNKTAYDSLSTGTIKNTLFINNTTDLALANGASTANFTYCAFSQRASFGGTGNQFGIVPANVVVDLAGNNLHLVCTGNSLVDAGTTMSYTIDKDYLTRPMGAGYDIGAYECPGIGIAKSVSRSWGYIGDTVTFCLTYTNGTTSDSYTEIWDTVPANMQFVFCEDCDVQTFGSYNVVHWSRTIGAGQSGMVCFSARITGYPFLNGTGSYMAILREEEILNFGKYNSVYALTAFSGLSKEGRATKTGNN